tara:strand:- start:3213 stop:4547 length:1335 start_codon:yes stop_codon:yes gene_type:complete
MRVKIKRLLKENIQNYSDEQIEKARLVIARLIDTTLTKPTLDVNTFADREDEIDRDRYTWFRDNPSEFIDAYSDQDEDDEGYDFDKESKSYGPIRDPKETSLLYYLYKGVYKSGGKFYIGNDNNIDKVVKEIRMRANAFIDAIGDYQILVDVFFSDFNDVKKGVNRHVSSQTEPSLVSSFMSKGAPGDFKRLQFAKFRSGALFGTSNTQGIEGTRDHMYKGSKEFDNIPDEHKPYFLFDYIWDVCYTLAQSDGLKQKNNVIPLDRGTFLINYLNGLTKSEEKARQHSHGPHAKAISKAPASARVHLMMPLYLQAFLNSDEIVRPYKKPVSEMSDSEINDNFSAVFSQDLDRTKEALKMGVYPSGMINVLRVADSIPEFLLDKFERKINRTIKGMEMAGFLDEEGEFTDKVKDRDAGELSAVKDGRLSDLFKEHKVIKVRILGGK